MAHTTWLFYHANERTAYNLAEEQYFNYKFNTDKEIWTSNPIHAAYTDLKLHKLYYPIYDEGLAGDFFDYLQQNSDEIGAVALDNCGGGIICPPYDLVCEQRTEQTISYLDSTMNKSLDLNYGRCWYKIWTISS